MGSNTINIQFGGSVDLNLALQPPTTEPDTIVIVTYKGFTAQAKGNHMAYTMPVDTFIEIQVAYVDAHGNPAKVDGDVQWTSSNPSIASVDSTGPDAAKVTTLGPLGTTQIVAAADADLGEGTRELLTTLDVTIVAGEAVAGTINVTSPPQPV